MIARRLATVATVASTAALAVPALAAAPARITPRGVGPVKVHQLFTKARATGVVGRQRGGCELDGPGNRAARLLSPLGGAVELTRTTPRRIKSIVVNKGATARGVAIGDTKSDILAAYPKAKFDDSTKDVFGITLVRIPKNGGGRLQMALDADTGKLTEFGIPFIKFCE